MPQNIALIVLDTVRADIFQKNAIRIQSLADRSYNKCLSGSSWTVPSHSSMLTGNPPSESSNGVHARNPYFNTLKVEDTFFDSLSAYHCIGVSANGFLTPEFGFDSFFDTFNSFHGNEVFRPGGIDIVTFLERSPTNWKKYLQFTKEALSSSNPIHSIENAIYMKWNDVSSETFLPRLGDYGASLAISQAKHYLKTAPKDKPKFLFMNVVDAHDPHEPTTTINDSDVPSSWTSSKFDRWEINNSDDPSQFTRYFENYQKLYSSSVSYLDKKIDNFINWTTNNISGETTFIITSDHGELLGYASEDNHIEHQSGLQFPLIHVPLEIINPPEIHTLLDSNTPVSLLQIPALISDIATGTERFDRNYNLVSERIGIFQAPEENAEYWDRTVRSLFTPNTDTLFRWDSLGTMETVNSKLPSEEKETTKIESLPSQCVAAFASDINDSRYRRNHIDDSVLESATQRQLKDLGYL